MKVLSGRAFLKEKAHIFLEHAVSRKVKLFSANILAGREIDV